MTSIPSDAGASRASVLRDVVAELVADDVGREALVRIVLDELGKRTVRARRLEVLDPAGRVRVRAEAGDRFGQLRVFGFSPADAPDSCTNWAGLYAGEDAQEEPDVGVGLWSGDEQVASMTATEGRHGVPGSPLLELERFRHDGGYGPGGKLTTERTDRLVVSADDISWPS